MKQRMIRAQLPGQALPVPELHKLYRSSLAAWASDPKHCLGPRPFQLGAQPCKCNKTGAAPTALCWRRSNR